jgi:alkylhydroperoxidase/carboxymuconolactone decarboxylase family protein YurZ
MKSKAPVAFREFVKRFPELGEAWNAMRRAEAGAGPLDERTRRLVKLAAAVGSGRRGGVTSGVRKSLAAGVTQEELDQVVACAASVVGMPAAVAAYGWIREAAEEAGE